MIESTVSSALRPHLSAVERAASMGYATGLRAGRDAIECGTWSAARPDWSPADDWFFQAANAARKQLPDEVATALAWFDAVRAGWNHVGWAASARKRVRSSLPLAAVWS